jgi:hypothetical protein
MTIEDAFSRLAAVTFAGILACAATVLSAPAGAQICANDPSRTLFAGGPGTDACDNINDQTTCEKSFHRSGAGQLAPCVWTSGNGCFGNTANFEDSAPASCDTLPEPQTCIDPTRTIALTGGLGGGPRVEACREMSDEESCEMAWHTTRKGVGIACCWDGTDCVGSVNGFYSGTCTHGNTCFASTAGQQSAPTVGTWGLVLAATVLLALGVTALRPGRSAA